jgi:hypothetical protein
MAMKIITKEKKKKKKECHNSCQKNLHSRCGANQRAVVIISGWVSSPYNKILMLVVSLQIKPLKWKCSLLIPIFY